MTIDELWERIVELEGEAFYTATGLAFTYEVIDDHQIQPYRDGRTRWKLSKNLFAKALKFPKYSGADFNNTIIGSSYVAGILNDERIGA